MVRKKITQNSDQMKSWSLESRVQFEKDGPNKFWYIISRNIEANDKTFSNTSVIGRGWSSNSLRARWIKSCNRIFLKDFWEMWKMKTNCLKEKVKNKTKKSKEGLKNMNSIGGVGWEGRNKKRLAFWRGK